MTGLGEDPASYVRLVLDGYRAAPGTSGVVRQADRELALRLWERGVPLKVVLNAFVLAAARRLKLPGERQLGVIRSLAYFEPVIEEIVEAKIPDGYIDYLRDWLVRTGRRMTA